VRRLAQGMAAFLPVSLLLFLCLFPGSPILFPWVLNPIPEKQTWLNLPFLFSRDLLGLLALYSFGLRISSARSVPRLERLLTSSGGTFQSSGPFSPGNGVGLKQSGSGTIGSSPS